MAKYDKDAIKEKLTFDMVFEIVEEFGGEPRPTNFGFVASTICHNHAGEGSHKLYYYTNTALFRCYTECDGYFDIFELISKIKEVENPARAWSLYDSMRWVSLRYGWNPAVEEFVENELMDWKILEKYDKIYKDKEENSLFELKKYDINILKRFSYPLIADWIEEGISKEVLQRNLIGYYPGGEQITIPHFDINNRFIGLRGRALSQEDAELYGKYRPIKIGDEMFNHPLGRNLYNLNHSAENIRKVKKAIIFEGEKSCLLYQSYFGYEADISVACCGSSITTWQMETLMSLGVNEIIIAFDRQFQELGDDEYNRLTRKFIGIHNKYCPYVTTSFIFDKKKELPYKASPIDCGKELFLNLYQKRVKL